MYTRVLFFIYPLYFHLTVRVITQFAGYKILDALLLSFQAIAHDKLKVVSVQP